MPDDYKWSKKGVNVWDIYTSYCAERDDDPPSYEELKNNTGDAWEKAFEQFCLETAIKKGVRMASRTWPEQRKDRPSKEVQFYKTAIDDFNPEDWDDCESTAKAKLIADVKEGNRPDTYLHPWARGNYGRTIANSILLKKIEDERIRAGVFSRQQMGPSDDTSDGGMSGPYVGIDDGDKTQDIFLSILERWYTEGKIRRKRGRELMRATQYLRRLEQMNPRELAQLCGVTTSNSKSIRDFYKLALELREELMGRLGDWGSEDD